DRQPAHLDVAIEAARPAEGQPLLGRDVAGYLAPDADVATFDRRLDGGRRLDGDIAGRLQVALDVACDLEVALDLETTLQDVSGSKTHDIRTAVLCAGNLNRGLFSLSQL